MRLKRLELVGFKSFANRVCLEFGRGITAIVGPNGSGKSNISDAVRWVLGEQSARTLRGQKMEDVIFSGSDGKKPLGMAEVQLTLDNSEGFLPIDFSEVTVTRRVYRSGESEFLINGKQCRLRDIQDLFTDTGLGREGYAIIGQGQIDAVLSVRSQDRRVVLEETAGIIKYRLRKEAALQKIEQTNQDLVRVADILGELDQRLGPLQKEAEKTRRYQALGERLLLLEQDYYGLELQRLARSRAQLEEEQAELQGVAGTLAQEQGQLEEAIARLDQRLHQVTTDLEAGQARQFQLAEGQNALENTVNVKAERQRNNAQRLQSLASLSASKDAQLEDLQGQRQTVLAQLERALEKCEEAAGAADQAAHRLKERQDARQRLRNQLEEAKDEFFEFMRSLTELRNFQRNFDKDEQALTRQIKGKEEEASACAVAVKQLKAQVEEIKALQKAEEEKKAGAKAEEVALRQKAYDLRQRTEGEKEKLRHIQAKSTQIHARLTTLRELDGDYEGYSASVKRLMQEGRHRELILGTVADVLKVPQGLELAFEVALGSALQNIITPSEGAAETLIQWLKDKNAGRATFLPLDAMRPSRFTPAQQGALRMPGVLGTGDDLAECEERFRPVIQSLLGRTVIAEDLNSAVALRRRLQQFSRIVTRDGSVVYPSGAMTGGSQTTRTSGLLSRKTEISKLEEALEAQAKAEKEQLQAIEELETALSSIGKRLQELSEQQVAGQMEIQRLTQVLEQLSRDIAREEQQHSGLLQEASQLDQAREALLAQAETAAAQVEREEAAEGEHRRAIQELEEELQELEMEIEAAQDQLTQVKVQLEAAKGIAENFRMQLTAIDRQVDEAEAALSEAKREIEELHLAQATLAKEIEAAQTDLELSKKSRADLSAKIECLRQERDQIQDQLKAHNNRLKQVSSELTQIERKLYRNESELKLKAGEEERISELLEERNLRPAEVRAREVTRPKGELKKAIDELREEIRSLGMVNPGAAEEYEQVKERHHFLTMQMDDLNGAKAQLHKAIAEMDEICRAKFQETFAQVRAEFSTLFTELFQGGKADLCLTEPDSPLTTGIEVVAQPPGKKLQNLLLLSGGERALTAIALLFAIRRVKPTPFCILDEIDAALDEANLNRFARLMREFSETTQLLTITHRQATMESADALYGVTMTDEAVSQIISVRMKQEG
ncbi:MAG TPA: chromosome segregation protein SMC [Firmicutes bacterium]|jgi:chromosome segregation protein|nr:chromosome segregation protein SMC [Bacillota bacterium]